MLHAEEVFQKKTVIWRSNSILIPIEIFYLDGLWRVQQILVSANSIYANHTLSD